MRKYLKIITIAAACLSAAAVATSQEGQQMTEDQLAVMATINSMTSAFRDGDLDGVMNTYESEATIIFEPGSPMTGSANLRAGFQEFIAASPVFVFGQHEVIIQGDVAVHTTPWHMTGTMPDGEKLSQGGLSVAVLKRQADGTWLMVIDNPYGDALTPAVE